MWSILSLGFVQNVAEFINSASFCKLKEIYWSSWNDMQSKWLWSFKTGIIKLLLQRQFFKDSIQMDIAWIHSIWQIHIKEWCMELWSCCMGDMLFRKRTIQWTIQRRSCEEDWERRSTWKTKSLQWHSLLIDEWLLERESRRKTILFRSIEQTWERAWSIIHPINQQTTITQSPHTTVFMNKTHVMAFPWWKWMNLSLMTLNFG